ncbi:MAG: OmpA family protein [Gammaproteobacteria bacterium]|nr:OmpA family protein [Gammaproteobacteria bacterium]
MNTASTFSRLRDCRLGAAVATALLLAQIAPTPGMAATPEASARASKPESVGVAGGFAVGAAAGGPIGALVGAAAGGWLGDRMHRESRDHAATRERLAAADRRAAGLSMHLMFRTADAQVRVDDEPLLAQFAALATAMPAATVHVTGFTDPRGSARYNAALATERASGVAARLIDAGVPADRLVVGAEIAEPLDPAAAVDLDGYAFQRRVTLRIQAPATTTQGGLAQRR